MAEFPIIDISKQDIDNYEQMGTKSKFWYTDNSDGKEYLFKSIHTEDKNQKTIIRHGENWSEKVACEIARKLGIPHAEYDLAINNGEYGIRSENFITPGDTLTFGNSLIEHVVTKILGEALEKGQRSQTISRVFAILRHLVVAPPKGWKTTDHIIDAYDVFIGYVMFDALISNQDRHNENWAMVTDKDGNVSLSPSFDHAASLGRNESDEKRQVRLTTKDKGQNVETYVGKCKSYFYLEGNRLKTVKAFTYFASMSPDAGLEWLDRLNNLDRNHIKDILSAIPTQIMSDISKEFCLAMFTENRTKLLECRVEIIKNKKFLEEQGKK
ncbi:HipA domain-containing protein [Aliivibrio fischeri]|uniref:HipA domain-containing protein n=1 Tax=Aliivibrio fischeri TaxID=668 RepID=UPI0012D9C352|nr:hypothetical protein [Aliivibrio fischeri]